MTVVRPPQSFTRACEEVGIALPDDERDALGRYLHLLLETNKQFNLTAIREGDEAWMRHILDSLSLIPYLPQADPERSEGPGPLPQAPLTLTDVGTGGGLPGIPLAITQPHLDVTLLEATGKKARFCQSAIDDLKLPNASVVNDRAETVGQLSEHRQCYDVAVARAVGPMRVMLELTLPLVKVGGCVLAMKGRRIESELDEAGDALATFGAGELTLNEALPGLDAHAVVVEITKASPTPKTYPRRPGEPKTNPL